MSLFSSRPEAQKQSIWNRAEAPGAPAQQEQEQEQAQPAQVAQDGLRPVAQEVAPVLAHYAEGASGGGKRLPPVVRAKMEHAFGADFSDVRIHEGSRAQGLGALAYAQGSDIHFAPGHYDPTSSSGQALLGHELTHVLQQRAGRVATPQGKGAPINADAGLEAEADEMGERAARGERVTVSGAAVGPGARGGAPIQCKRVRLGDVGNNEVVDSDTLGPEALRRNLDDPSLSRRGRTELREAERRRAMRGQGALAQTTLLARFKLRFNNEMAAYPHVALPIEDKVGSLLSALATQGIDDFRVEDYSAEVFGMAALHHQLNRANVRLAPNPEGGHQVPEAEAARARALITDLLLACTLIPSQEKQRKFFGNLSEHFSRYAIEAVSPAVAIRAIQQIVATLASDGNKDVHQAAHFAHTGLNDNDTHAQRLMKLSLLSTSEEVRQGLENDQLFQDILQSGRVAQFMMTSTGADEQYFLNTCPMAARNADMASHSGSIAVLLAAGRRLAQGLVADVNDPANQAQAGAHLTPFQTAGALVRRRTTQALAKFDEIDAEAREMIQSGRFNTKEMRKLRRRWSRVMQKLGAVVNWKTPNKLPQLTAKYFKDHWWGSAGTALIAGTIPSLLTPNARTAKRFTSPDKGAYNQLTGHSIEGPAPGGNVTLASMQEAGKTTDEVWTRLFKVGGCPFEQDGHVLYMKAIKRNGVKLFAVNDPMERTFKYYTFDEWVRFMGEKERGLPSSVAMG